MTTLLSTYVMGETEDLKIQERLKGKMKSNGAWNTDDFSNIKLDKLTKQHVKDFHKRLGAETPYVANRVLAALFTAITWDMNRTNPMFQKDHNPCLGISFLSKVFFISLILLGIHDGSDLYGTKTSSTYEPW